jgi:hypothetical protein
MIPQLRSILIGTSGLWLAAAGATWLTFGRRIKDKSPAPRDRTVALFMIGLAAQCLHFAEEFYTRFEDRFPALLNLSPWPPNFFVLFNMSWLSLWILSAIGLRNEWRIALLPVWLFALSSILNGIGHPLLSIIGHGYFPGLLTSPLVGLIGLLLLRALLHLTRSAPSTDIFLDYLSR